MMGEVQKGQTKKGVDLYFFPHHAHTEREVFQRKEGAGRNMNGHMKPDGLDGV